MVGRGIGFEEVVFKVVELTVFDGSRHRGSAGGDENGVCVFTELVIFCKFFGIGFFPFWCLKRWRVDCGVYIERDLGAAALPNKFC